MQLDKEPSGKDGEGYVYLLRDRDVEGEWKIGYCIDLPKHLEQLASKNKKNYEYIAFWRVEFRKQSERVVRKDLHARGMGLPKKADYLGNCINGGTKWFCV